MENTIRLAGVYDIDTLRFARELGIGSYSIDFRPKSFNFLQGHKFLEMIKQHYTPLERYYLHFAEEKSFVVKKIISDLSTCLDSMGESTRDGNIYLEFSDNLEVAYYDQFKVPFVWHYQPSAQSKDIFSSKYLRGIVLSFSLLDSYHQMGRLEEMVLDVHSNLKNQSNDGHKIDLLLSRDWDSNIFPSLREYFEFDTVSFPINNIVERGYRQVHHPAIEQNLRNFVG